jgi:hypothetical protein
MLLVPLFIKYAQNRKIGNPNNSEVFGAIKSKGLETG